MKLLEMPDVVKSLVSNPKYSELSEVSKVTHALLTQLKHIQNDGTGLPRLVSTDVIKSCLEACKQAVETVVITFALFTTLHKVPPMQSRDVRNKELDNLTTLMSNQGVSIEGTDLEKKIMELREGP